MNEVAYPVYRLACSAAVLDSTMFKVHTAVYDITT